MLSNLKSLLSKTIPNRLLNRQTGFDSIVPFFS